MRANLFCRPQAANLSLSASQPLNLSTSGRSITWRSSTRWTSRPAERSAKWTRARTRSQVSARPSYGSRASGIRSSHARARIDSIALAGRDSFGGKQLDARADCAMDVAGNSKRANSPGRLAGWLATTRAGGSAGRPVGGPREWERSSARLTSARSAGRPSILVRALARAPLGANLIERPRARPAAPDSAALRYLLVINGAEAGRARQTDFQRRLAGCHWRPQWMRRNCNCAGRVLLSAHSSGSQVDARLPLERARTDATAN